MSGLINTVKEIASSVTPGFLQSHESNPEDVRHDFPTSQHDTTETAIPTGSESQWSTTSQVSNTPAATPIETPEEKQIQDTEMELRRKHDTLIDDLKNRIKQLERENSSYEQTMTGFKDSLNVLEKENSELRPLKKNVDSLELANGELKEKLVEMNRVEDINAKLRSELDDATAWQRENQDLRSRIIELESQLGLVDRLKQENQQLNNLPQEVDRLRKDNQLLQGSLTDFQAKESKIAQLMEENARLGRELEKSRQWQGENQGLRSKISELESQLVMVDRLKQENQKLQANSSKLQPLENSNAQLLQENRQLRANLDEIARRESDYANLEKKLRDLEGEKNDLSARWEREEGDFTNRLQTLGHENKSIVQERDQNYRKIMELQNRLKEIQVSQGSTEDLGKNYRQLQRINHLAHHGIALAMLEEDARHLREKERKLLDEAFEIIFHLGKWFYQMLDLTPGKEDAIMNKDLGEHWDLGKHEEKVEKVKKRKSPRQPVQSSTSQIVTPQINVPRLNLIRRTI